MMNVRVHPLDYIAFISKVLPKHVFNTAQATGSFLTLSLRVSDHPKSHLVIHLPFQISG